MRVKMRMRMRMTTMVRIYEIESKICGKWKLRPGHKISLAPPICYLSKGPNIH